MDIALVVSDVDGTLVTTDKRLTPASIAAVRRLEAAGIGFTIASSRPPVGFRSLVEPLDLRLPIGAFNGGTVVGPDLMPLSQALIPQDAARRAVESLLLAGIDVWVFSEGVWHLRDPAAPYSDLERRTLGVEPKVVDDLGSLLGAAQKIVGVSADADGLARAESRLSGSLGTEANVERSQAYYLDVTPPDASKGSFVLEMSRRLGITPERIATIGDGGNDKAMFAVSGLSIAMANARPDVQAVAKAVTSSNDEDGFAQAVDRFVLGKPSES
jgi:Cof subfamily protein (haloacid dehalogenase superfamily)